MCALVDLLLTQSTVTTDSETIEEEIQDKEEEEEEDENVVIPTDKPEEMAPAAKTEPTGKNERER